MPPAIPDGWLKYTPVGNKIKGTRFIAFKVPLQKHVASSVRQDIRLDCDILLEKIPNLGLIIDLTNTDRYYNHSFFEIKGIAYEKIMIPGKLTPSKYLTNRFAKVVNNFIATNKDNDKLIGVHCTHGVNRTGYLICDYMIRHMNVEPQKAMNSHQIERTNYIESLIKAENYGINQQSHSRYVSSSRPLSKHPPSYTQGHNRQGEKWFERQSNNPTSSLRIDYYNNEPYGKTANYNCKGKNNDI